MSKSILQPKTSGQLSWNLVAESNYLLRVLQKPPEYKRIKTEKAESNTPKESKLWLYSLNAFYRKLETEYSEAFPDVAKPYLMSISQVDNSMTTLNDLVKELSVKIERGPKFDHTILELMTFPNRLPRIALDLMRFMGLHLLQYLFGSDENENESSEWRSKIIE